MSLTAIAFWVVLLLLAGYAIVLYNGLVRLKHSVGKQGLGQHRRAPQATP